MTKEERERLNKAKDIAKAIEEGLQKGTITAIETELDTGGFKIIYKRRIKEDIRQTKLEL